MSQHLVDAKPAVASKINWTATIGALGAIGTVFGIDITPESQAQILAGIIAIQNVAIVIQRTWFTTSVTPQSMT